MAHSLSAKKRVRQNETRNGLNRFRKRKMRDAIKELLEKIAHGTVDEAKAAFKTAARVIDRTSSKGTIHKNQGARRKSRLNARLKTRVISGAPAGTKSAAKKVKKS
ncbi:MAG: 30S ribosomal protein S20 [Phycisphaerales bacterium]|nr:30S ribosomal protein S20 [Phycisphaerales bacterium]